MAATTSSSPAELTSLPGSSFFEIYDDRVSHKQQNKANQPSRPHGIGAAPPPVPAGSSGGGLTNNSVRRGESGGGLPQLPTGQCNFVDLAHGAAGQRCGCRRFWSRRQAVVRGSDGVGIGGQDASGEDWWCMCTHHACFHDQGSVTAAAGQAMAGQPSQPHQAVEKRSHTGGKQPSEAIRPSVILVQDAARPPAGPVTADRTMFRPREPLSPVVLDMGGQVHGQVHARTAPLPSLDTGTFEDPGFFVDAMHHDADAASRAGTTDDDQQQEQSSLPDTLSWRQFILQNPSLQQQQAQGSATGAGSDGARGPSSRPSPTASPASNGGAENPATGLPPIPRECMLSVPGPGSTQDRHHHSDARPPSQPSSTTSSARRSYMRPFAGKGLGTLRTVQSSPLAGRGVFQRQSSRDRNHLGRDDGRRSGTASTIPASKDRQPLQAAADTIGPAATAGDALAPPSRARRRSDRRSATPPAQHQIHTAPSSGQDAPTFSHANNNGSMVLYNETSSAAVVDSALGASSWVTTFQQQLSSTLQSHEERLERLESGSLAAEALARQANSGGHVADDAEAIAACHDRHEHTDVRLAELEARVEEVERSVLNDGASSIAGGPRHAHRMLPPAPPSVAPTDVTAGTTATDASRLTAVPDVEARLGALQRQLDRLLASPALPPTLQNPWEVEVVFMPFPLPGLWLTVRELAAASQRNTPAPTSAAPGEERGLVPPVIPSVAAEMVWDGAAWPPPLGDASSVSSSSSATSSPRMRHRNDFDDDGYGDEYDEDDEYDEHDGEWLYPRACAPGKMLDQRLASRGFVKTVQVTGGDYRSFRDALLVAFAGVLAPSPPPVPEQAMAVEGTRSSGGASVAMRRLSSSTSLRSSATQTKLAERYLGLREPLIPLRKVHKDSRLRFLEPSEMASPALWTSNFLRSTVVMKGAGPVQRLYVTTADAYLQGRLGQAGGRRGKRSAANAGQSHQGWTWQRVRELSRVYDTEATKENVDKDRDDEDAEMSGVGVGVPEADALEECWAWNERFDRQTPGVVPDNAVRKRRRHHQGHRPAAILHNEVSGLTNAMSDDQFYTGRESLSTDPRTTQQRSITRSPLMERRRQAADMGRQHQPLQPNNSAGHSTRDPTSGPILPGSSPAISGRHTSHRPTKLRTTSMPPSLPPLVTSRSSPGPYATASPHNKRRFAAYGGDGRSGAPSPLKPGHMRLVDDYDDDGADQDQAHLPPMRRSTGNMSWVPSGRDASKRRRTRSPSIGANAAYAQQHRQHHNRQQDEGEPSSARSLKTKPLVSRRQTPSLATITPKWSNLSSPSPGPLDTAAAQAYYPQQHHLQQKEPRGVQVGGRGTTPGHHYATPRSAVVRGASTGPVAASGYDDMRYQADDDGDSYVGALREPQQTRDGESDLFVYEDEDEDEEDRGRLVEYESDDGDDDDDGSGDSHRRRPLRESLVSIPRQAADGVFDRGPPTPRAAYSPPQHHRQPSISQRRPSLGAQQHHNAHQYHRLGNRHPLGIVGAGAVPVAPAATTVGLPPEDEPWPGIESDGQDELDEERGDDDYYDDYDHHGGDDDASSTSGLEQASQELSLQDRQRSVAPPGSSFDYHHQMTGGDSVSRRSSSSSVPSEYPATQRASAAVDRGRVAAGQSPFLPQGGTSFDIHVDEEERRRESERVVAFA